MKIKTARPFLAGLCLIPLISAGQAIDTTAIQKIRLEMFPAEGLVWKEETAQNTNWNKITETPDGKIWFCGGDHWGTDQITGPWGKGESYERPWGFGNTTISYYDPQAKKSFIATDDENNPLELDRSSAIYSNRETPGHGKSHSNITSDSKGRVYYAGYMGLSYRHEYTRAYYPKSYAGAAIVRYDPATKDVDYLGVPYPNGGVVGIYYDEKRNIINGITVDRAKFFRVNLTTMELNHYESIARMSRVEDRVREMIMDKEGFCYFANDVGGLTKFNPDTQKFTDIDVTLPGKLMDFRASVVSSKNIIYAISTDGYVWSYEPKTNKLEDFGHVIGMPGQGHYTPNIALDEEWGRLYFMAGNHGGKVLESALEVLTALDIKKKKFYWIGQVEGVEGCFGALASKDHSVYFSSFGDLYKNNKRVTDKNGKGVTRPYLVRYQAPKDLESLPKIQSGGGK
jgi:streptogramin lyase